MDLKACVPKLFDLKMPLIPVLTHRKTFLCLDQLSLQLVWAYRAHSLAGSIKYNVKRAGIGIGSEGRGRNLGSPGGLRGGGDRVHFRKMSEFMDKED